MRQDDRSARQEGVNADGVPADMGFPLIGPYGPLISSTHIRELTMADVAFVVTTVAIFALVAFVAKGVAKL
ncbi:hypothetical protein AB6O49_30745 [Streptomyces sp. SBR177]|uniref:hypothetical protein n=1 Tax=Streptomyces sp. NPDC046275 TaxID=3157201 RepID=UPI0033CA0419